MAWDLTKWRPGVSESWAEPQLAPQGCSAPKGEARCLPGTTPQSRLLGSPPPLQTPRLDWETPRGDSPVSTPRTPRPGPAGCLHLAQEPSETLAVELHVHPLPGPRRRAPRPWTSFRAGSRTAAAEVQASQSCPRPRPFPGSKVLPRPTPKLSGLSSRESNQRPNVDPERRRKGVSARGAQPSLLEGNLGTSVRRGIGRTRGEAVKGGRSNSRCFGREFLEGCVKFSRVSRKIKTKNCSSI